MSFPNVVDVNAQSESTEQGKGKEGWDISSTKYGKESWACSARVRRVVFNPLLPPPSPAHTLNREP